MADLGAHRFRKKLYHPFRMFGRFEVTVNHSCTRKNILQTNSSGRLGTNAERKGLLLLDSLVSIHFTIPFPGYVAIFVLDNKGLLEPHARAIQKGKLQKHAGTRLLEDFAFNVVCPGTSVPRSTGSPRTLMSGACRN